MIVIIDNYDSFTYNLVQCFGEMGADVQVYRNDQVTTRELRSLAPSHIVISPGPGRPADGGISSEVIREFFQTTPILGVCLGHQCIGHVFGGTVSRSTRLMHGKTSRIFHGGRSIYQGLDNPFEAGRYHSLMVQEPLPPELLVTARAESGEVMGLEHEEFPLFGVQFHPESVLTPLGKLLLKNFFECSPMNSNQGGRSLERVVSN